MLLNESYLGGNVYEGLGRFHRDNKGQGLVEYGLIMALVSVVAVGALGGVGDKVSDTFSLINDDDIASKIERGYIPIATSDDLYNLRHNKMQTFGNGTVWEGEYQSGLSGKYVQVADIDLNGINFNPIDKEWGEPFTGVFDGNSFVIDHLFIDRPNSSCLGLFGRVEDGLLHDIYLNNVDINGFWHVSGLVGSQTNSTISNRLVSGDIVGSGHMVGGLVGIQYDHSSILDSVFNGSVLGKDYVGGLVGKQIYSSNISNSYSIADVYRTDSRVGGFLGRNGSRSTVFGSAFSTPNNIGIIGIGSYGGSIVEMDELSSVEVERIINTHFK